MASTSSDPFVRVRVVVFARIHGLGHVVGPCPSCSWPRFLRFPRRRMPIGPIRRPLLVRGGAPLRSSPLSAPRWSTATALAAFRRSPFRTRLISGLHHSFRSLKPPSAPLPTGGPDGALFRAPFPPSLPPPPLPSRVAPSPLLPRLLPRVIRVSAELRRRGDPPASGGDRTPRPCVGSGVAFHRTSEGAYHFAASGDCRPDKARLDGEQSVKLINKKFDYLREILAAPAMQPYYKCSAGLVGSSSTSHRRGEQLIWLGTTDLGGLLKPAAIRLV